MSAPAPAATQLTMQFMDVGQGDAIYIEFPDGTTMLVDFGSTKNPKLTLRTDILTYFRTNTRFAAPHQRLDYLVLTHGDIDHYNGVLKLVNSLQPVIGNLLFGGLESDYGTLIADLKVKYPAMKVFDPGANPGPFNLSTFGGAAVHVLAINVPAVTHLSDDAWRKNTSSVVLQIKFANRSVILSGDATRDTEQHILTTQKAFGTLDSLKSGALKVGHHGSARTSIRPEWIRAVSPVWIFIPSDRSGTLGDEKEERTGHRLPQELAIDIIRSNTTLATGESHQYFSSYDEQDYTGYANPDPDAMVAKGFDEGPQVREWLKKNPGRKRGWINPTTTEAIYTSLSTLDAKFPDGTIADQGVQYGMVIRSDESVQLLVTAA